MAWTQLWQLTALIAVVAAIVRLTANRRPHLAHVLWLVVLAKCLTPPVMASPAGIFCWLQPSRSIPTVHEESSVEPVLTEHVSLNGMGRPVFLAAGFDHVDEDRAQTARTATLSESAALNRFELAEQSMAQSGDPRSGDLSTNPSLFLPGELLWGGLFWLAGGVVLAMAAAARLAHCVRSIHRSGVECPPELAALVAD